MVSCLLNGTETSLSAKSACWLKVSDILARFQILVPNSGGGRGKINSCF